MYFAYFDDVQKEKDNTSIKNSTNVHGGKSDLFILTIEFMLGTQLRFKKWMFRW